MSAVQLFAQSQGCINLQWQTPAWNQLAIRFYDRLGATGVAKQCYTLLLRDMDQAHRPAPDSSR